MCLCVCLFWLTKSFQLIILCTSSQFDYFLFSPEFFMPFFKWKLGHDLKLYWCGVFVSLTLTILGIIHICFEWATIYAEAMREEWYDWDGTKKVQIFYENFDLTWAHLIFFSSTKSVSIHFYSSIFRDEKHARKCTRNEQFSKVICRSHYIKLLCGEFQFQICVTIFFSFWTGSMEILIHFDCL